MLVLQSFAGNTAGFFVGKVMLRGLSYDFTTFIHLLSVSYRSRLFQGHNVSER